MPPRKIYGRDPDVTVERAMWSLSRLLGSQGGRTRSAAPVPKKGPTSSVEPSDASGAALIEWFYSDGSLSIAASGSDYDALIHFDGESLLDYSTATDPTVVSDGIYYISVSVQPSAPDEVANSGFEVVIAGFAQPASQQMHGTMSHLSASSNIGYSSCSCITSLVAGDDIQIYISNASTNTASYQTFGQIVKLG